MRVSEIRVKQICVNQGLGVLSFASGFFLSQHKKNHVSQFATAKIRGHEKHLMLTITSISVM